MHAADLLQGHGTPCIRIVKILPLLYSDKVNKCQTNIRGRLALTVNVQRGNRGTKQNRSQKYQNFTGLADRYFLTISAILKMIAWSNSRKSRPVSFLIFSRR